MEGDARTVDGAEEAHYEGVAEVRSGAGMDAHREGSMGSDLVGEDRSCKTAKVPRVIERAGEGLSGYLGIRYKEGD